MLPTTLAASPELRGAALLRVMGRFRDVLDHLPGHAAGSAPGNQPTLEFGLKKFARLCIIFDFNINDLPILHLFDSLIIEMTI